MIRCKLQAKKCKFRDGREISERLLEQLIIGAIHKTVQETLLGKDEKLTLDDVMDIARTRNMKQLAGESSSSINTVRKTNRHSHPDKCSYCGGNHPAKPRKGCPAYVCSMYRVWKSKSLEIGLHVKSEKKLCS